MLRFSEMIRLLTSVVPLMLATAAQTAPPASIPGSLPAAIASPAGPMPVGWGPHGKKLYYFMVFGNATPGNDAELNRWYDRIHAPLMIERGDFVWAQRFMISPAQFAGSGEELKKRHYMVIFALETNDIEGAIKDTGVRLHSPRNVTSRALDYQSLTSITYEAIGPATTQKDARRLLDEETAAGHVPKAGDPPLPGSFNPFVDTPRAASPEISAVQPSMKGAPDKRR